MNAHQTTHTAAPQYKIRRAAPTSSKSPRNWYLSKLTPGSGWEVVSGSTGSRQTAINALSAAKGV